jgi:hypothetical protein
MNGTLTLDIKLSMTFLDEYKSESKFVNPFEVNDDMVQSIRNLYGDSEFADFTFIVGSREFKVHKNILAMRSEVFKALFTTDMLEKKTGSCVVANIEADTFELLLNFIYAREIEDLEVGEVIKLFEAAHYYEVKRLKEFCKANLGKYLKKKTAKDNAFEIYAFSKKFGDDELIHDSWMIIKKDILKIFVPMNNEPLPVKRTKILIRKHTELNELIGSYLK